MTNEQLVRAYMAGDTYRVIGERYGLSAQSVHKRVQRLKDEGVALPLRTSGKRPAPVDVEALNAIVRGGG